MHPVINCEWPRWNDGVWCLIYQPLIVTCCMLYGPLHGSNQHVQRLCCSSVMMVSLNEAGVRRPVTDVRQRNSSICVPHVCSMHCHYARTSLQFADHLADLTGRLCCSQLDAAKKVTQHLLHTSRTMGDTGQTGSALLLYHVAIYLRTEASWGTWQHDTRGRTIVPSTAGNHIHTLSLRWH